MTSNQYYAVKISSLSCAQFIAILLDEFPQSSATTGLLPQTIFTDSIHSFYFSLRLPHANAGFLFGISPFIPSGNRSL